MKQKIEVFADFFQFYLQDEQSDGNLSDSWTSQAVSDMLAVAPGVIGVGTARNMIVPVEIEVLDSKPNDNFDHWDHVTETSLEVPSGRIIIAGCTDYFPEAPRIIVEPGTYRVRVYYNALDSVDESRLEGDDYYKVVLWLDANIVEPQVLKRWASM
ncbi:hypothetical protein [Chroogloeocystis siderophila]|jgi:hypothetical protein|uniref:Uncharacterized protein n=1 Tax=Chroogloeocystis siderophila 5.2 s.c.1 TaxID=247279 RepID=A0A1U7HBP0_9CHRO|nr:hypothetical protein [Chroogloeocystis siderophila]OKH20945.1 hypothetical protein NIES1031_22585 [Chroogloeocystis siderophila 5.2 s.c.1]